MGNQQTKDGMGLSQAPIPREEWQIELSVVLAKLERIRERLNHFKQVEHNEFERAFPVDKVVLFKLLEEGRTMFFKLKEKNKHLNIDWDPYEVRIDHLTQRIAQIKCRPDLTEEGTIKHMSKTE
mmetsp:Transcript_3487/g.5125  ORF Transcript_3487/g.5125 Transcript_3487/m.5125 type:complete len:124 (-) Transcript_3487:99-470(-)